MTKWKSFLTLATNVDIIERLKLSFFKSAIRSPRPLMSRVGPFAAHSIALQHGQGPINARKMWTGPTRSSKSPPRRHNRQSTPGLKPHSTTAGVDNFAKCACTGVQDLDQGRDTCDIGGEASAIKRSCRFLSSIVFLRLRGD